MNSRFGAVNIAHNGKTDKHPSFEDMLSRLQTNYLISQPASLLSNTCLKAMSSLYELISVSVKQKTFW